MKKTLKILFSLAIIIGIVWLACHTARELRYINQHYHSYSRYEAVLIALSKSFTLMAAGYFGSSALIKLWPFK